MTYYDSEYFNWQNNIGQFGGKANLFKFKDYIKPEYNVLEFGCGGGYLLKNITCREKTGIEINKVAREVATSNGIIVVPKTSDITDEWADVIISNHTLEHTLDPLGELRELNLKLKQKGIILFVVPQEFKNRYKEEDINMHLYSWTPANLGNLFKMAGFKVIKVKTLRSKWPPYFVFINRIFGEKSFRIISTLYCIITNRGYQTWILAEKK